LERDDDRLCNKKNLSFVNPYSYFGQPSVWPRGYPLEEINDSLYCDTYKYKLYEQHDKVPLIQQGLVNGDPDVDSIYRLTRKNDQLLNIEFDENAPPLILNANNQYAPLNSQNTFYHYDAFFTLIFPRNTTDRECDILRGYIAIRLLREIDGRVSFMPPNAFQIRNIHSYHKDYLLEKRLFERIYEFVRDLDEWSCHKATIKECLIECIQVLVDKKHLNVNELEFYKMWIKDLDALRYKWPKIKRTREEKAVSSKQIYYKSIEKDHSSNSNKNELSLIKLNEHLEQMNYVESECKIKLEYKINPCKFDKFLLVTSASNTKELQYLNSFFKLHFPYMVICVNENALVKNFISAENSALTSFTILVERNFTECIRLASIIGFKSQALIVAKDFKHFLFWSETIEIFDRLNRTIEEEKFYMMRKNVANGVKVIKIGLNNTKSYCWFYENKKGK